MSAKSRLWKIIAIDLFDILLVCIKFAFTYSMLIRNRRQFWSCSISIYTIYGLVCFLSFNSPICLFLPLLNSINLNPLWIDSIPYFDRLEVVCFLLRDMCLTSSIFISSLQLRISAALLILAGCLSSKAVSFLFRTRFFL